MQSRKVLKCLLILQLLQCIKMAGIFSRSMHFVNVVTQHNAYYFSNFSAWIHNDSLNMDMTTRRLVTNGLLSSMDVQIQLKGNERYQSLFSYDFDMCKMMNEHLGAGLMKLWLRNAIKYGNMMEHCPIPKGRYYMHDFRLEPGSIPAYLLPGDYRVIAHTYYGKRNTKRERLFHHLTSYFVIY